MCDSHCDKKNLWIQCLAHHIILCLYCMMEIVVGYSAHLSATAGDADAPSSLDLVHEQLGFCINWHDPSNSRTHQTIPEGAALAVRKGHIYPRLSPVSVSPKPKHNEKFIAPFLALLFLLFAQALTAFSAALCLIENTFLSSTLLPCWQRVSRTVSICIRRQCLAVRQEEG